MKTENLSTLKIHKLSQEQYERAHKEGRINEGEMYLTPDEKLTAADVGARPDTWMPTASDVGAVPADQFNVYRSGDWVIWEGPTSTELMLRTDTEFVHHHTLDIPLPLRLDNEDYYNIQVTLGEDSLPELIGLAYSIVEDTTDFAHPQHVLTIHLDTYDIESQYTVVINARIFITSVKEVL